MLFLEVQYESLLYIFIVFALHTRYFLCLPEHMKYNYNHKLLLVNSAALACLDSQLHHLNSGGSLGSVQSAPLCTVAQKLSPDRKLGASLGLTTFVSLSGITVLYYMICNV